MRHKKSKILNIPFFARKNISKIMLLNFIKSNGNISTTKHKAKILKSLTDSFIYHCKKNSENNLKFIKFLEKYGPSFVNYSKQISDFILNWPNKAGGYSRIIKLGHRSGDGAKKSILKLIV